MTFEYKNEFVDQNPYLVYSPDADATAISNSGEGGGIYIDLDMDTMTLNKKAGELFELMKQSLVSARTATDAEIQYIPLFVAAINDEEYQFTSSIGEQTLQFLAASANDYPVYVEG